jgi:hypothetical protein
VADKGKYIGDVEYGRITYGGCYVGDVEYGRFPAIGYYHEATLTVQSSPDTGVSIAVSVADFYGNSNGTTNFDRYYRTYGNERITVQLTAPSTFGGRTFYKWTVGGVDYFTEQINVKMDDDKTAIVYYKHQYALKIQSMPTEGVSITVSPNDVNGNGNGTTNFERTYWEGADVTITAPGTFGGEPFSTWKVDGSPVAGNPIIVTMGANHTALAEYGAAPPPPEITKGVEMLYVKIPRKKFWIADYPKLDPNAEGRPIPLAWGKVSDVCPVCIDVDELTFKLYDNYGRAMKAVDQVRDGKGNVLILNTDYTIDLNTATIQINGTPLLIANTTYYFSIEASNIINGTDYFRFAAYTENPYSGGQAYEIDGSDIWTPKTGWDLSFAIYAREGSLSSNEFVLVSYTPSGGISDWALRDTSSRTRIGQSFTTPATGGPWYVSWILFWQMENIGTPSGLIKVKFFSAISPESQRGCESNSYEARLHEAPFAFPQRAEASDIRVDFQAVKNPDTSLMENVADILKDSYMTVMGGSESALDAAALAALKAARTEKLSVLIDDEIQYREFLDKLEAGQFFKFLPTLDWKFTTLYAASGEPGGTIHFRDEDFKSFRCFRKWSSVYQKIKVKYAENPTTNEWQTKQAESELAAYCYRVQRTLETETFFSEAADAQGCADTYSGLVDLPLRIIEFTTASGKGFGLIPWQKIKVSRERADAPGGSLAGVLFRVLEISQNPISGEVKITAVLDEQTY